MSMAYLEWRSIHYLESRFEDDQENISVFTSIILQVRTLLFLLDQSMRVSSDERLFFYTFSQFLRFTWLIIILNYTTIYRLYWTILKEIRDWKTNEKEYKINKKEIQEKIRMNLVVQDKKNHKITVKRRILKKN
jgi:hypothetical protein